MLKNNHSATEVLILKAPLSGPLMAMEHVPDPVFAQKMVGDGISIDPTDQYLLAPCDGKVVQLHRANHAVTIESNNGIEILMHIGIDTVTLKGEGFFPQVAVGDNVKQGETLIEFDADLVASRAKSLLTQIIITNGERVQKFGYSEGFVNKSQDNILLLTCHVDTLPQQADSHSDSVSSANIIIPNPTGLHARPSAVLVSAAKEYASDICLFFEDKKANAKSVISIMGADIPCGANIRLEATGTDASIAIEQLSLMVKNGLGEDCSPIETATLTDFIDNELDTEVTPRSSNPNILLGVSASPGFAIGNVVQLKREEIDVVETALDANKERAQFESSLKQALTQLEALKSSIEDKDKAAIFAAHIELIEDPELIDSTFQMISQGKSAAFAWKTSYTRQANQLAKLENKLLNERANDLNDIGRRVLQLILGLEQDKLTLADNCILIAEDLTPSDTAQLDKNKVLGFCTVFGGSSSHVAIIARSMNIPAIAGIETRALSLEEGQTVILDAVTGSLKLNPSEQELHDIESAQKRLQEKQAVDIKNAKLPAITTDDVRIEVVANIANRVDAEQANELGAEGVGLLRSEFLFMNRATAPTEEEQFECYAKIINALDKNQPLIIRTLDVGGDKPLSYLPIAKEDNPFLGLRGVRVSLQRKAIFRIQLRAILRAAELGNVHIMFPMITTLEDLRQAKAILEEERIAMNAKPVPVGIMVEVPSTAIMAPQFAKEADFFSIGTNDLTQYTTAIDRGHPTLATQADGLNPAVLQLIANTANGAHQHSKWAGVCGGIASDELAVPILVGLGIDELSVSVPSIPTIKALIRSLDRAQCQVLAQQALTLDTASDVRALATAFLANRSSQ